MRLRSSTKRWNLNTLSIPPCSVPLGLQFVSKPPTQNPQHAQPRDATSGGGSGHYSIDRPTLESLVKTYTKMFVTLSKTTLILTSRSYSKRKWLKPLVELVDFTNDEPMSRHHRSFISYLMDSILLGLCSWGNKLSIWVGVDHRRHTPSSERPEIASPISSQISGTNWNFWISTMSLCNL